MYRNKKDVDQHVESLITKLSSKEFIARGYSIGRLYYDVGDYSSCQKYIEKYLSQEDSNAAAHALLGRALLNLRQKDKALEEFKKSYSLCPSQKTLVLNICEILAGDEVDINTGRAKYWCDKAETMFPNHPVTFRLRQKLMSIANPDPEAHAKLLTEELAIRPKDVLLHIRLLDLYLKNDNIEEAFIHSCNVEFSETNFMNNFEWYKTLSKILNTNPRNIRDWNFQLLMLTVAERLCSLSLTDLQNRRCLDCLEVTELLHEYDHVLERVANSGIDAGHREFHASLLQHHRSQFAFLAATFLLQRSHNKNCMNVPTDSDFEPLMLIAWHSSPFDPAANWVNSAPKIQQIAARRWYCEGSYRCSQAGHFILSNFNEKSQSFLNRVSRTVTGSRWKEELYENIFSMKFHFQKNYSTSLLSESFRAPILELPKMSEVQIYDEEAQRAYGNSLHHYLWMLLNYKDFSQFKCTTFDGLPLSNQNDLNCGPESLCQLDVYAFLYCAALTCNRNRFFQTKPKMLPANITEMLCTLAQMKWWDCAFKFSRNELGAEMTDIRATLSRGIDVVRCIDNHGLNPELLWKVGCIFSDRAKNITDIVEKRSWSMRAIFYFSSAIPLWEKVHSDIYKSENRMFEYTNTYSIAKESSMVEECKLSVASYQLDNGEYEKVIKLLENLKCPRAFYYLGVAYKKMALDGDSFQANNMNDEGKDKFISLMSKAQKYGIEAIYMLRNSSFQSKSQLHIETEALLREINFHLNKNNSVLETSENRNKDSSDEYVSLHCDEDSIPMNFSTPVRQTTLTSSDYGTAAQSLGVKFNEKYSEHSKRQASNLQQHDTMETLIDMHRTMFYENRVLLTQIINNTNNTADQFALLKASVDQVKNQIGELIKDMNKLKTTSSEQAMVENELLNLSEEYRANDSASTYAAQLPFTAQQVMSPFNQRLLPSFSVPPNPFQMYGQNLFNFYNQYSQLPQNPPVPGAPLFDAARSQVNYPGVFPTPDQMYLDVANLVQPTMPVTTTTLPVVTLSHSAAPSSTASKPINLEAKEIPKSMPVTSDVAILSPDHITTTAPTTALSSISPSKHVQGTPHNYQIQMPETNKTIPSFSCPTPTNKTNSNTPHFFHFPKVFASPFANSTARTLSFSSNMTNNEVMTGPADDSHNKTRTTSEKSNTSVDNYDPCPDFKPIIPLPDEVKVTTGEENESVIFSARAKLYRFDDNQWKERGLGEMKLLKHKDTGKVRVLMRREQIHKICANHIITPNMEIQPMKNETKAYFWVANDFADEKIVLERFSIRFKTADIAKQFYETFNKARFETDVSNKNSQSTESDEVSNTDKSNNEVQKSNNDTEPQPAKTVVGGFTFSSTPAFKPIDDKTTRGKPIENSAPTKVNVFSGLQFKMGTSSLFSNLVTNQEPTANNSNNDDQENTLNKLNASSEYVEDFESTAEFKPVIPMLDLVETKTGEEDEIVLFEHRAKLLRFSAPSKEWKERGIGIIKILANKENDQKIRLLMRREQVMKVCCNHFITKEMVFQNMPNMDKAVTWCAQDFSEGELVMETLCLRFKTKQACDTFIDAVKLAQSKLKDESKAAKEEKNAAKQNSQPETISGSQIVSNWAKQFKPKKGSWECKECLVRNEVNVENCSACGAKHPQLSNKPQISTGNNQTQFKFGAPSQFPNDHNKTNESPNLNTALSGWGDKFKPKQGSWECDACLVRNNPDVEICTACNTSRHGGTKSDTKTPFNFESKFKFGIPFQAKEEQPKEPINWGNMFKASGSWECKNCYVRNGGNVEICCSCSSSKGSVVPAKSSTVTWSAATGSLQKNEPASIFDGTGVHKFNFGIPANAQGKFASRFPKLDNNVTSSNMVKLGNEGSNNNSSEKPAKPALLPTPQIASDSSTFDFVFKPKSPIKAKSPGKSSNPEKDDEIDENEYASEDEGHHIKITPIVPLPDKVKVLTGEEDENELFGHRAKLLIFVSGEWKERGIGVVKILRHKHTAKLRVVMRREQVFKICLNHALTPEIIYNLKDDKNWIFAANDFSEGELSLQRFCLKFKTKEIALDFKNAIDMARNSKNDVSQESTIDECKDSDEVQFITETQSNVEEKRKAKDLMLPENFYLYKDKEACPGCRGCTDDPNAVPVIANKNEQEPGAVQTSPTFSLPSQLSFAKDSISFFKTTDSQNVFKIPQSIDSNNGSNKSEQNHRLSTNIAKNKNEKSLIQQPTFTPNSSSTGVNKTNLETTLNESQGADPKAIFSNANARMTNKLFNIKPNENSHVEVKSIFDKSLSSTLTTGEKSDGKSIGRTTAPNTSKIFDSQCSFTKEKSHSNEGLQKMAIKSGENKTNSATSNVPILGNKQDFEDLTFNAISNRPEISFQSNPNFKWEGAGQQLFANTLVNKNTSGNKDDAGNDGEEEYDPHYEPIVDLPDKISVTTGEEDEEKLFGENCKLYRFSDSSEWKERGVGELKVLYHPEKKTYRLLCRRHQVHKVVLNMLLNCDLELWPMKSDNSWMFAGRNFVDGALADHETLAVRFKDAALANRFKGTVENCVRKLQSAAAQAHREKQEEEKPAAAAAFVTSAAPASSAAFVVSAAPASPAAFVAPAASAAFVAPATFVAPAASAAFVAPTTSAAFVAPAAFATPAKTAAPAASADHSVADLRTSDDEYDYDEDQYDTEEEERVYFSCDCEAELQKNGAMSSCAHALVQVLDAAYAPKVLITNAATGQLLCEMLILDDFEIELSENTCSWVGTDFTASNDSADTFVIVHFPDTETALQFYNSCEEIKGNSAAADEES